MELAVLGGSILLLLLLIAGLKLNAFLALILTSFVTGLANGMGPDAALKSMLKGIGDTMGSLVLILVFGAILGKLIEESGAAHTISYALIDLFGERRIQLSVLITGFIVGLPMIYNASFLVLIPLIYTLSATTRLPLMYLGIPLSSALSVTHGYLPPHPAPTSIAVLYGADVNQTLLYGLLLSVPAIVLAGPVLARFFRDLRTEPPPGLFENLEFERSKLPGLALSLLTTSVPVILMLLAAVVALAYPADNRFAKLAKFVGDPNIALLLAVLTGFYALGLRRGRSMDELMKSVATATASVSMVILIIASGGAFKQVLLDCGTGEAIKNVAVSTALSPVLLAWGTAALVRLAVGSATVAAITAAGIVLPIIPGSGVRPELLVIATTAGSLMFSHFNDIGFWMFKEYYNVTVKQTFAIWTVMESIVAVVGLAGVLILQAITGTVPAQGASRPKVFYVNSYHSGYPASDASMAGIRDTLSQAGVQVETFFLDAKRRPDPKQIRATAEKGVERVRELKPDLIIACDDDAARYFVAPHFRGGTVPVVFCGVNWSADQYGFNVPNITGMLEIVPVEAALKEIRRAYPGARKLLVLSEDSTSERSNRDLLDGRYKELGFSTEYALVSSFEAWKRELAAAQSRFDVIYLPTNGAIQDWDEAAARRWVSEHARIPVFTCDDFMVPYAAFGLTKIAREQGEWAARTALEILKGRNPNQIPVARNEQVRCYLNPTLARKVGFAPAAHLDCTPLE